jgi:hypothetical protein
MPQRDQPFARAYRIHHRELRRHAQPPAGAPPNLARPAEAGDNSLSKILTPTHAAFSTRYPNPSPETTPEILDTAAIVSLRAKSP